MKNVHSAVAVLFPGVNATDIANAAIQHEANIVVKELYAEQKDYSRFFKRSRRVITGTSLNLLFIFSDGSSIMAQDRSTLKAALEKVNEVNGYFV